MKIHPTLNHFAVKTFGHNNKRNFLLVHGYGCNQGVWKGLIPPLEKHGRVIVYDHIGSGNSDYKLYSRERYNSLHQYADDLIQICEHLSLEDITVVGHSVGATIAALACIRKPELFSNLVMISPSPCFINQGQYFGGFERWEIDQLMELMDKDYVSWTEYLTPILLGRQREDPDEKLAELRNWFCQIDRDIAKHFARVTFYADHRAEMEKIMTPTMIIQCTDDTIAPLTVGNQLFESISDSKLVHVNATGHCPHITHPEETFHAMKECFASN